MKRFFCQIIASLNLRIDFSHAIKIYVTSHKYWRVYNITSNVCGIDHKIVDHIHIDYKMFLDGANLFTDNLLHIKTRLPQTSFNENA